MSALFVMNLLLAVVVVHVLLHLVRRVLNYVEDVELASIARKRKEKNHG